MLDAPKVRQKQQNIYKMIPQEIAALQSLSQAVAKSGLEPEILELVKLRASQLNGCAFCLQMHATDARKLHMSEEKLQLLAAWHEAPVYSERERAALAWTEAVTLIADTHAPDDLYADVRKDFSEAETVNLTMLIATINAWNRLAISFRSVPPVRAKAATAA